MRTSGIRRLGRRLAVVTAVVTSAMAIGTVPAHAHVVAALPGDNLIANPWFSRIVNGEPQADTTGWVLVGSPTWGTGHAKADCPGPEPYGTMPTLRWARNISQTPQFHPDVEVRAHTIVAANGSHRTLKFFMHWVMHRMTLRAVVHGGTTANGPWTQLWTPFQHTETVNWQPSPSEPRSEAWKHFTSMPGKFDDWFAPVPRQITLAQGYAFYKVELRASYPAPDATATGGVGGKLTGVYFATSG